MWDAVDVTAISQQLAAARMKRNDCMRISRDWRDAMHLYHIQDFKTVNYAPTLYLLQAARVTL